METDEGFAWRSVCCWRLGSSGNREFYVAYEDGDHQRKHRVLAQAVSSLTTAEYRSRFGILNYWSCGLVDQPQVEAIHAAELGLEVDDDACEPIPVPISVLEAGFVYLRATVVLGSFTRVDEVAERLAHGLPPADEDRVAQMQELVDAVRRVVAVVFDDD